MELPEQIYSIGFWVKFVILFGAFVILPIFKLNFTGGMGFGTKVLFMLGGAVAIMFALQGKTLRKNKYQRREYQ